MCRFFESYYSHKPLENTMKKITAPLDISEPNTCVIDRRYQGNCTVCIRYVYNKDNMAIYVFNEQTADTARLVIQFKQFFPQLFLEFSGRTERSVWPLVKEFQLESDHNPFAKIYREIYQELWSSKFYPQMFGGNDEFRANKGRISAIMHECFLDIRNIAVLAAERLSEPHKKEALKFPTKNRLDIYYLLLADKTGRLIQLIDAYPGVLIFAAALAKRDRLSKKIAKQLIRSIIAGDKLNASIDKAVYAWAKLAPYYSSMTGKYMGVGFFYVNQMMQRDEYMSFANLYQRVQADRSEIYRYNLYRRDRKRKAGKFLPAYSDYPEGSYTWNGVDKNNKERLIAQRILIKKAKTAVAPNALWLPAPLSFEPSDIPENIRENALWFRVMRRSHRLFTDNVAEETAMRMALSSCLSKNYKFAKRRFSVNRLFDYLLFINKLPARASNIQRLVKESKDWHRMFGNIPRLAIKKYINEPLYCLPTFDDGRVSITPIAHFRALALEGANMYHCVASRIDYAVQRQRAYAHALIDEEALTVEVLIDQTPIQLGEVRGKANKEPTMQALDALQQWIKCLNEDISCLETACISDNGLYLA